MASDADGSEAHGYSASKRGILLVLKQAPDASLEEVAHKLGISKVAALGHLQKLENEGLIDRSYRAGHVGRPSVQFRLTPKANGLFPQSYAEVSMAALEFIERRLGPEAVAQLLTERAHEVADRARPRLSGRTLPDRVRELARMRTEGGYMAEIGAQRRARSRCSSTIAPSSRWRTDSRWPARRSAVCSRTCSAPTST